MIAREHYPLEKAAKILNCSVDDLIYLGSIGTLKVYILTGSFRLKAHSVYSCEFRKKYQDQTYEVFPHTRYAQLMPACLARIEAHQDTDVILERKPIFFDEEQLIGYFHYSLRREDYFYPDFEMLTEWLRNGRNIDDITPPPVKVSECKMVVMANDLERYQQSTIEPAKNQVTPNGHKERHAKNREEVLGAALSVLAAWPEKCRYSNGKINASAIAELVIEKGYQFWHENGEPPLKKDKISRLVSDWIGKVKQYKPVE